MPTRKRWIARLGVASIGWGLLVGPWPALDSHLTESSLVRDTPARIRAAAPAIVAAGLRVGVAEIDLTPAAPVPVAGFIGQILQPYEGIDARCFGRALSVANGTITVTILTADLLLIDDRLARAISRRTGLPRDQVYLTASHTHSGPGGWGNHPLERLVAGSFDPEVFEHLTDRLARVILASRSALAPAEAAFVRADVTGIQRNRITPGQPTNDALSAWVFRSVAAGGGSRPLATLAVFGAHATLGHPIPARLGGDYPAAFAEALRRQGRAGVVLFAAGTVGDASPVRPAARNQRRSVQAYGAILADRLATLLDSAEFHRAIDLANRGLEVGLPPVQVPFGSARLRFSPVAVWWIGRRTTFLHVLKVGPAVLVGFPGDVAGHLAARLRASGPVVATSFNGDYKGYLVTAATFRESPCYETRGMNFFGPNLGEDLVKLAQGAIDSLGRNGR